MEMGWGLNGWRAAGILGAGGRLCFAYLFMYLFFCVFLQKKNTKKRRKNNMFKKMPPGNFHRPAPQIETDIPVDCPQKNIGLVGLAKGAPLWQFRKQR